MSRWGPLGLLIVVPLVLTGCAAAGATTGRAAATTSPTAAPSSGPRTPPMASSMVMAPGESMAAVTATTAVAPPGGGASGAGPSTSARMICGPETAGNVATLLGLRAPVRPVSTWVDHLYTCTYQLPVGALVLSVKQSAQVPAARSYFSQVRAHLGVTQPVTGLAALGLPAYENTTGAVVFLKDTMTLQVNATALPQRVGPQHTSPTDLAYTLATDVLACWTNK